MDIELYTILQYSIYMNYAVRIKKIIGQLEALARLSDGSVECDKVLQQVNAVQGAVMSLKRQIIDDSLERCVESPSSQEDAQKLLTSIRRYI